MKKKRQLRRAERLVGQGEELWVAPSHSLKAIRGEERESDNRATRPNTSRLLELADIALGLKKPAKARAAAAAVGRHSISKAAR